MSKKRTPPEQNSDASSDDRSLWQRVAETVTPLSRRDARHDRVRDHQDTSDRRHEDLDAPPDAEALRQSQSDAPSHVAKPKGRGGPQHGSPRSSPPPKPTSLAHSDGRKLRRGRIAIEARLDLHGMRQNEAHAALKRFLFSCHHKGQRWVLVITGKGVRRTEHSRGYGTDYDADNRSEPGVLRRMVPVWLHQADLHAIVIGFESAGPQHGGDGALYVNIRRAKPPR